METKQNTFKSARNLIVIMNLLASILFFVSYLFLKNFWLLIAAIILIIGAVIGYFVINSLEEKLLSGNKRKEM